MSDKVKCECCDGTGKIACEKCKGEKKVECPDCKGSGKTYSICPNCHEGRVPDPRGADDDDTMPCPVCHGNYKTADGKCKTCGGTGKVDCGSCKGSGEEECYYCDGTGEFDISSWINDVIKTDWYAIEKFDAKIDDDKFSLAAEDKDDKLKVSMLRKAAESGNGAACYLLGLVESESSMLNRWSFAEYEYFDMGAELGDANCLYASTVISMAEAGGDWEQVIDYLQQAADKGHLHALIDLARYSYNGYPGWENMEDNELYKPDFKRCISCCEKLALVTWQKGMNKHLVEKANAIGKYLPKIIQGDIGAMMDLGHFYIKLFAETKYSDDQWHGIRWIKIAAEKGNGDAVLELAQHEKNKDLGAAVELLDKAAQGGDKAAKEQLKALMLECTKSQTKFDELKKIADAGNVGAMKFIASMYIDGTVGKDQHTRDAQATHWLEKAADSGDGAAMLDLSVRYRNGKGTIGVGCFRDVNRALTLTVDGFNNGGSKRRAIRLLAEFYRNGYFAAPDYEKAIVLYVRSANAGYAPAMIALGRMYVEGVGVKKDLCEAKRLFEMAAAKKSKDADAELKKLPPGTKSSKKPVSGVTGVAGKGPLPDFVLNDYKKAKDGTLWTIAFEKKRMEAQESGTPMVATGKKKRWLFVLVGIIFAAIGLQFIYAKRWGWWIMHVVLLVCGAFIPPAFVAVGLLWIGSLLFMKKDGDGKVMS